MWASRSCSTFAEVEVRHLCFMKLPQFLLVFAVVCILTLVAAKELLDLLSVLSLELLQSSFLLLLKLSLGLAERPQLLLKGPSHLLHLPRHGHHALCVLPEKTGMKGWVDLWVSGFQTEPGIIFKRSTPGGDALAWGFWSSDCQMFLRLTEHKTICKVTHQTLAKLLEFFSIQICQRNISRHWKTRSKLTDMWKRRGRYSKHL